MPRKAEYEGRLAAHLQRRIDAREISSSELARDTGYSAKHITRAIAGQRPMSAQLANALAYATATRIEDLFSPRDVRTLRRWMESAA